MKEDYKPGIVAKVFGGIVLIMLIVGAIWGVMWLMDAAMPDAMSNEDIIREMKSCTDNGLKPNGMTNINDEIVRVQCEAK